MYWLVIFNLTGHSNYAKVVVEIFIFSLVCGRCYKITPVVKTFFKMETCQLFFHDGFLARLISVLYTP